LSNMTPFEGATPKDRPLRIGLIVPSSNTVMEPDFHQQIGRTATVSTTRIFLEEVTRGEELRMLDNDLPKAIELIRTTAPDVVVFGCTSAGALGTLAHDREIGERIRKGAGAPAITVLEAVLTQVRAIDPRKIALFTPYTEDLTNSIASSLTEAGYPPMKAVGMGILANLDIGRVPPSEVIRFVESQVKGCSPDCVFLSCTNWRSVEAIEPLQKKLGIPIVTSNQAALDAVRRVGTGSPLMGSA
jgi:maleate isomerase